MLIYTYTIEKKGNEMKHILALVLLTAAVAQAQVYVPPGGTPTCYPITVATPSGFQTVIVCQ